MNTHGAWGALSELTYLTKGSTLRARSSRRVSGVGGGGRPAAPDGDPGAGTRAFRSECCTRRDALVDPAAGPMGVKSEESSEAPD